MMITGTSLPGDLEFEEGDRGDYFSLTTVGAESCNTGK